MPSRPWPLSNGHSRDAGGVQTPSSEVIRFFEAYARAFDAYDSMAILDFYSDHCAFVNDTRTRAPMTRDALLSGLPRRLLRYRDQGFAHAKGDVRYEQGLSQHLVLAAVEWRLLRADGSCIDEFTVTYALRREPQGYRIAAVINPGDK